jgi:hypothetical protein
MATVSYKLSPSDFAFLYQDCKRCFYRKVKLGIAPPRTPLANIFTSIDGAMKEAFTKGDLSNFFPNLPSMFHMEGWDERFLVSQPFQVPEYDFSLYILGKLDNLSQLSDKSGYCITDYKTTKPKPEHVEKYARQQHAYKFCLEHPGKDKFGKMSPLITPVTHLGLACFEPSSFKVKKDECLAGLYGGYDYLAIPVSEEKFLDFLGEVADLIAQEDLPESGEYCTYCQYLNNLGVK